MLMAEEEGHTCLRRALGSIGRGDFTEGKALLQRAYFCGCALAHMQCIWAGLWSVRGQPDKALQSLEVWTGTSWSHGPPRAQLLRSRRPLTHPLPGPRPWPRPLVPRPDLTSPKGLLQPLWTMCGCCRGFWSIWARSADFTDLAQRATSGALPWAPAERVLGYDFEEVLGPLFLWSRMEDWVFVTRLYSERSMGYAAEEDDAEEDNVNRPAPEARAKSHSGIRVSGARVSGGSGTRVSGPSGKPHPTPRKSTRCPRQ